MRLFKNYLDKKTYNAFKTTKMISSICLIGCLILVLGFYFFGESEYLLFGILILLTVISIEVYNWFNNENKIHLAGFELLAIYTLLIMMSESRNIYSEILFILMILSIVVNEFSSLLLYRHNREVKAFLLIKNMDVDLLRKYESFESAEKGIYGIYYVKDLFEINLTHLGFLRKKVSIKYKSENIHIKTRRRKVYVAFFNKTELDDFASKSKIVVSVKENPLKFLKRKR